MTCPFDITTATNSIRLDSQRQGEAAFTVYNRSGRPVRGRSQLAAQDPASAGWISLVGEVERSFALASTEQIGVRIQVPPTAKAGQYAFRLDMVGVENPDEDYCAGPSVTFDVPEPVADKPFPWKWVAVLVAGLVVIGVAAFLLWPRQVEVPSLAGLAVSDARATLEAVGLGEGSLSEGEGGEIEPGRVVASTPGAGSEVAADTPVDLVVAAAQTPTPVPTPAPTPTVTDLVGEIAEIGASGTDVINGAMTFRVTAHDPSVGSNDGDGIASVLFQVLYNGEVVYEKEERDAPYCAFAGGQGSCTTWYFHDNNYLWPSEEPITIGTNLLRVLIRAVSGQEKVIERSIVIEN
jgi:hypothetical protein